MLLPLLIRAHCMSPNALDKATVVNVASRPCKIRRTAIAEPTSILNIACKVFVALFVNWLENAALAYHAVRPKIPVVKTARKRRKPVCASVERRVVRVSPSSMGTRGCVEGELRFLGRVVGGDHYFWHSEPCLLEFPCLLFLV